MDKQTPFTNAATKERKYALQYFLDKGYTEDNIEFTPSDGVDRYDGILTKHNGDKILFEIKIRDVKSDQYKTSMLDESKYLILLEEAKKINAIPAAMFFYNDGKLLALNLLKNPPVKVSERWMPRTTAINTGRCTKRIAEFKIKKESLVDYKKP